MCRSRSVENQLWSDINKSDNWMVLNAKCCQCDAKQITLTCPMSTNLSGFPCMSCGNRSSVKPTRVLMVNGDPVKTYRDGGVLLKSIECKALESMYETEYQEAQEV